jgi:hypothetical protein
MSQFNRQSVDYRPKPITSADISLLKNPVSKSMESSVAIAKKFIKHLDAVKEYRDRIDAVNYLIDQAEQLAGNVRIDVKDESIQTAIKALGGSGKYIDFDLFKKAVEVMDTAYAELALIEFTGVRK